MTESQCSWPWLILCMCASEADLAPYPLDCAGRQKPEPIIVRWSWFSLVNYFEYQGRIQSDAADSFNFMLQVAVLPVISHVAEPRQCSQANW